MISVQTLDRKIWRRDLLLIYLHECNSKNKNAIIDFNPEGSCAEMLGLYRLLDEFCQATGYDKHRITIKTANMIEQHSEYVISKQPGYWYEIKSIQKWLRGKKLDIQYQPNKHFGCFVSRSNWFRLWTATILDTYHRDQSIQTYHYDSSRENYNANGYIGVDDLFRYGCDLVPEAVNFLKTCPRTIDLEFLQDLKNTKGSLFQHENSYYPIQHPSNLNLLQYYNELFVDIVIESNISGNCFLVTEKLWRAILAHRPFIVVSNANYLRNLRRLGFKTFNFWWSEEYDQWTGQDRIKLIQLIIGEIAKLNITDLETLLIEMKEVLEHNYQTFVSLSTNQLSKEFING